MADTTANDVVLHITNEQVSLDVSPDATALSTEILCKRLHDAGVCHGIDKQALAAAVTAANKGELIKDHIVATYQAPVPAKPGRLNQLIKIGQIAMPGDVIAEFVPGEAGQHGVSVTGELIDAPAAAPVKLKPGANTEDDYGKLKATAYGAVKFKDNLISIEPPVHIAFDHMSAAIDLHPASQSGTGVSKDIVVKTLALFNINFGIDEEAIEKAIEESISTESSMLRLEVAKGRQAIAATNGDYKFRFSINGIDPKKILQAQDLSQLLQEPVILPLVDEGSVLCEVISPTPARTGKNIYSKDVAPPPSTDKLPLLSCGENVAIDQTTNNFVADIARCGYADIEEGKIHVRSPALVSQDEMSALLTIYPPFAGERTITKKEIMTILADLGVNYGISEQFIDEALANCEQSKQPQFNIKIASGQQGKAGEDAYLEYLIDIERQVGQERDDGTIDFRERGTIVNVEAGDALCKRIPPEPGKSQVTVLGETFPASAGVDIEFTAGENVELRDGVFYALQAGALMIRDNAVHVSDIYQHEGDVDLSSGNLHQNKGSIHIKGGVNSGFEVKASGHVSVDQLVDNGRLIAGADVFVKGGVIQPEKGEGYIHGMGNVVVKFVQNGKIFSYKNVTVNDFCMNASVHAKGNIEVTKGKGCIVGGITKATKSIHAKQLGSEANVSTLVEIEYDPKEARQLLQAIEAKKLHVKAGNATMEELDVLLKKQKEYNRKIQDAAEIIVDGVIHPGVTLKILGVSLEITEPKRFCRVTLSPKKALLFSTLK